MCKIMEDLNNKAAKEAAAIAAKEADHNARKLNALTMIKIGKLSFEEIALYSGLTVDEVKTLAEGETA